MITKIGGKVTLMQDVTLLALEMVEGTLSQGMPRIHFQKQILPLSLHNEHSSADIFILAREADSELLTYTTVRE